MSFTVLLRKSRLHRNYSYLEEEPVVVATVSRIILLLLLAAAVVVALKSGATIPLATAVSLFP